MIGTIEATNKSQSGKTLGVKIGETWYTSKNWELENMVNQSIDFEPSSSNFNGKVMWWINDYVAANAPPTADQAFNQAHANYTPPQPGTGGPPPMGSPQPPQMAPQAPQSAPAPQTNKDCSIIAQALTKACTAPGDDVVMVWSRYCSFYRYAVKGVPDVDDQEIPF